MACSMGVQMAYDMKIKKLQVYGGFLLLIHQLNGKWETRDSKLIPYNKYIQKLTQTFKSITFKHVPRESNQIVDALATLSSMFNVAFNEDMQPIRIEKREAPVYCMSVEQEFVRKPWYHDIKHYITCREYPFGTSENSTRAIRKLAMNFFLSTEMMYKRNYDMTLLRCVEALKAKIILEEVYEGVYGTHANGHMMARQIMCVGYYCLTMESNCIKYARKCHNCQIYANKIHVLASPSMY